MANDVDSPSRPITISLTRLHRAIFQYYAHRRGESLSQALRSFAEAVVRADFRRGKFDPKAFRKFAVEAPGTDPSEKGEIVEEVDAFLKALAASEEETKTKR